MQFNSLKTKYYHNLQHRKTTEFKLEDLWLSHYNIAKLWNTNKNSVLWDMVTFNPKTYDYYFYYKRTCLLEHFILPIRPGF